MPRCPIRCSDIAASAPPRSPTDCMKSTAPAVVSAAAPFSVVVARPSREALVLNDMVGG